MQKNMASKGGSTKKNMVCKGGGAPKKWPLSFKSSDRVCNNANNSARRPKIAFQRF